jgi:DNA-binding transcriptional LysR family regulator
MLDLRRLRLLYELHERGTIAAVADALRFTPSAVSQQLAVLERETGVRLLERTGRSVRLTDAALVLVRHAAVLLDRAERAETDLAAAQGTAVGRGRIAAFQSVSLEIAVPAMATLAHASPDLRCELIDAEPEQALPALALGDFDLVLADEWPHQPRSRPPGVDRHELLADPIRVGLATDHSAAHADPAVLRLPDLANEPWVSSDPGMGWNEVTTRTCREHGNFDPDIRHRTNDAIVGLRLVANGLAVMLVPDLIATRSYPGVAIRDISGASLKRSVFAATRTADARRPSVNALLEAVRTAAAGVSATPNANTKSSDDLGAGRTRS